MFAALKIATYTETIVRMASGRRFFGLRWRCYARDEPGMRLKVAMEQTEIAGQGRCANKPASQPVPVNQ